MIKKISIIGTGNVGASICFLLAQKFLCHKLVMIDLLKDINYGKSLDLSQNYDNNFTQIKASQNYEDVKNSDIIVITAGSPRKEGMSRDDLLVKNANILKDIVLKIKDYAKNSIIIIVSNPIDVLTYLALKVGDFDKNKVIGMAGILDSARMNYFINEKLNFKYNNINSIVLGTHGDTMVALPRFCSINSLPLTHFLSNNEIQEIIQKTKQGGANIVKYMQTSAYFAPANATIKMIQAIALNTKEILPCSVFLEGEYGLKDLSLGVLVVLGRNGVQRRVSLNLNNQEKQELQKSAEQTNLLINKLKEYKIL